MRIVLAGLLVLTACCFGETRFYVDQRGDYAGGKNFGAPGIYEFITTKVVTDAGTGSAEVIKPRDPKLGNGTLILDVNGKGKLTPPEGTLSTGVTIVRLTWPDAASLNAAVTEITDFLKYKGGPMLLGDQRQFLKKAVAVDRGSWLAAFAKNGRNADAKGRVLLEGALRGPAAKAFDATKAGPLAK